MRDASPVRSNYHGRNFRAPVRLPGRRGETVVQGAVHRDGCLHSLPATSGSGIHATLTWQCVRQTSAAGRAQRAGRERVAHPPTSWIPDIPPRLVLPGLGQGAGGIYFVRQPSALSRKTSLPEEEAVNRQAAPPIVNRRPSIVTTDRTSVE